jgi:4-amino-4-deoxy-L-arabinose transferase-like glycosyltransferase
VRDRTTIIKTPVRNNTEIISLLIICLITGWCFWGFWDAPIYIWDEALYANNALEMAESNNPFLVTIDNIPDLTNTKPTLVVALQAMAIKAFGANEFSIRLPSVIAAILVYISLIVFSRKFLKSNFVGTLAVLILLSSNGIMISHGFRSGDLEGVYLFFSTLFVLNSLVLLQGKEDDRPKRIIMSAALFLLSFLCKSTAILLFIPGLFICFLLHKRLKALTGATTIISFVVILIIISLYYFIANGLNPGYLKAVFDSEVKRAFLNVMPWHRHGFTWYLNNLFTWRFTPFIYLLPFALLFALVNKGSKSSIIVRDMAIVSISYFVVISLVSTKLEWYDLPLYPMWSIVIAFSIKKICDKMLTTEKVRIAVMSCVLLAMGAFAVVNSFSYKNIKEHYLFEQPSLALHEIKNKNNLPLRHLKVWMPVDNSIHKLSIEFYRKARFNGWDIRVVNSFSDFKKSDTVMIPRAFFHSYEQLAEDIDSIRSYKHSILAIH